MPRCPSFISKGGGATISAMLLPQNNPKPPKWYFTFWGVVVLLVLFGPFAFPFLWKSNVISTRGKVVLTVIFSILTVWLLVHTFYVTQLMLEQFRKSGLLP